MAQVADVERDDAHRLAHRDDGEAGLLGHPLGGPVARARLGGVDARVRHELGRRAEDAGSLAVENDGAIHLAELADACRRELDVEDEATRADRLDDPVVAEHDESAGAAAENPLEPIAQLSPGSDRGEGRA